MILCKTKDYVFCFFYLAPASLRYLLIFCIVPPPVSLITRLVRLILYESLSSTSIDIFGLLKTILSFAQVESCCPAFSHEHQPSCLIPLAGLPS
jgi:hypothetical protein